MQSNGFGLTVSRFFQGLTDQELRKFLDPNVLPLLDALFDGCISGEMLCRVVTNLVDFDLLLGDSKGRQLIFDCLPSHKLSELETRVGRSINAESVSRWTKSEIDELRDFFSLVEELMVQPDSPSTVTITPNYDLFEHQRKAVSKLIPLLSTGERRAVLHLPTGVGKTRTAMHVVANILRIHDPSVVVWLASGRELLEQAVQAFKEAWMNLGTRPVALGRMWGNRTPDLESFSDGFLAVGLAKGWSVNSRKDPDWAVKLSNRVRLVVFDEAHQSIARTYQQITDDLTFHYSCALLGLTATPGRTWADIDEDGRLAEFFAESKVTLEVPGDNPIDFLIQNGYLAKPKFQTLFSQPGPVLEKEDLIGISEGLDIPEKNVAELSMSEQYVAKVLESINQLLNEGHKRVLVFAASVEHAKTLCAILIAREIRGYVITSLTSKRVRSNAIKIFKSDDDIPMVMVNFGVLTTGFDVPLASAVVIARPTRSLVLFSQMVGRAIRGPKAGGTEECTIVTIVDPNLPGFGDVANAFLNWEDVWQ